MKILTDTARTVVTHHRTLVVLDGPMTSAGDSYTEGTQFRADRVSFSWLEGKSPMTVRVFGPRLDSLGNVKHYADTQSVVMHELHYKLDDLPAEIKTILDAAGVSF